MGKTFLKVIAACVEVRRIPFIVAVPPANNLAKKFSLTGEFALFWTGGKNVFLKNIFCGRNIQPCSSSSCNTRTRARAEREGRNDDFFARPYVSPGATEKDGHKILCFEGNTWEDVTWVLSPPGHSDDSRVVRGRRIRQGLPL